MTNDIIQHRLSRIRVIRSDCFHYIAYRIIGGRPLFAEFQRVEYIISPYQFEFISGIPALQEPQINYVFFYRRRLEVVKHVDDASGIDAWLAYPRNTHPKCFAI